MGENIVHLPDGSTQHFPGDATPDEMNRALALNVPHGPPPPKSYNFDPALNGAIDFIRPHVANIAGGLAGAGVGALTKNPVVGMAAETQGYAGVDSLLQMMKAGDQRPASFSEALGEGEKQALLNAVGQRVMGSLWRGAQTFFSADQPEIYKFAPTTSQAMEAYGFHKIATVAKYAEDFGAAGAKSAALDRAGGAGFSQALGFANAINGRMFTINSDPVKLADKIRGTLEDGLDPISPLSQSYAKVGPGTLKQPPVTNTPLHIASQEALDILHGGSNPFSKLDDVLQDSDRLSKVLTVGQLQGQAGVNVRRDLQAYQFMRMINNSMTQDLKSGTRLDPGKIAKIWKDPDMQNSLDILWGKQGRQDVGDFLQKIAVTQDAQKSFQNAKALRFMSGGFALGTELLTGAVHLSSSLGAVGSLFVPAGIIGNILTKPGAARFLTAMAGGEPLSEGKALASRVITNALQGSSVAIINAQDNSKTWGHIVKDPQTGEMKFQEGN